MMEIKEVAKIHELISEERHIEAANAALVAAGKNPVVKNRAAANVVLKNLVQALLDNDLYLHAATLQWGPDVFLSDPESITRSFTAMHEGSMILFMGASSMGKCLHPDQGVLMFDGSIKKAKDVAVGDKLMGDDSTARNVIKVSSGRSKTYRVIPERGKPWICNKDHILSLRTSTTKICGNSGRPSKKTVKGAVVDIPIEEWIKLPKGRKAILKQFHVGVDFPAQEVPIDPYIYGAWIGDGGTDVPALHTPNGPMAKRWVEYFTGIGFRIHIGYEGKCPMWCARSNPASGGGGSENPFLNFIRSSVKDGEKFIRNDYLINSREVRLGLLAGLIDSDGWVSCKTSYGFVSKYRNLAEQVCWLARSLGFASTVYPKTAKIKSRGFGAVYWNVQISGQGISKIPTREKRAIESTSSKNLTNTGFRVEELPEGDYNGFVIDGNHRFLLDDFTVTHNTYGAGAWMLLDYLRDPLYTTVKLAAVNEDHLKKNLFAHVLNLFRACAVPLRDDIVYREADMWIGIKEAGHEFGISGIAFKQSQETSGQFKGYKAKPVRPKRHPRFGKMGRLRVLGDEGQNWPGGPFKDFNSLVASKIGSDLIKVAIAFNPESVSQYVVQMAEPEQGWNLEDLDTLYDWESRAGWRVCRLDAALCENVIKREVVYPGLQTYEGFMSYLKSGGDSSPNYMCVDENTEALSKRGWLSYDKLTTSDEIWTVNPETGEAEWQPVDFVFSKHLDGELVSMEGRGFSALVTDNHRWAVTHKQRLNAKKRHLSFKETKELSKHDLIPIGVAPASGGVVRQEENWFAELVGWVLSDGTFQPLGNGSKVCIYQSASANPEKCERIRTLLSQLRANHWEQRHNNIISFNFSGPLSIRVRNAAAPEKKLTMECITSLGFSERLSLMDGLILGDGGIQGGGTRYFCQADEGQARMFSALAATCGYATTHSRRWIPTTNLLKKQGHASAGHWMHYVNVRKSRFTRPQSIRFSINNYSGIVWCPRTKNMTFFARRNGTSYFTGNTFARGFPPMKGTHNTIIPPGWPQSQRGEATFIENPINVAACDLAFMGEDSAQMAVGRWGLASGWRDYRGQRHTFMDRVNTSQPKARHVLQIDQIIPLEKHDDTTIMAEEIIARCKMLEIKPEWVAVDKTSIGLGTYSHMQRVWGDVYGIGWNERASEKKILSEDKEPASSQCDGISSEMWWAFRRWLDPVCCGVLINPIIPTQPIQTQLTSRRYTTGKNGIKVEPKDQYKARNQKSPDEADAFVMMVHIVRKNSDVIPGLVEETKPQSEVLSGTVRPNFYKLGSVIDSQADEDDAIGIYEGASDSIDD